MVVDVIYLVIFAVVVGASYSSYKLGKRDGTAETVNYLIDMGKINIDDDELFHFYD